MLVDEAVLEVRAGDGGNGCVALHREAHNPRGGPVGGDGGKGGDVILQVRPGMATLLDFRYQPRHAAERGTHGQGARKTGKSGEDCVVPVPLGTIVRDADTRELLADLSLPGMAARVARGGVGGRGNASFATPAYQTPRFAERGRPGQRRRLALELKLLADVGVIGMPNVGKSTLISVVSAAKPKIADYPFTTLAPNLGVVQCGEYDSFVMADMPGLIEGASEGAGLGHRFLRHVDRTRLLLHMLDVAAIEGRDPWEDFAAINRELARHSERLAELPQIVALNKTDLVADTDAIARCQRELERQGHEVHSISAVTQQGVRPLVLRLGERLTELGARLTAAAADNVEPELIEATPAPRPLGARCREPGVFELSGTEPEELVAATAMENREALMHLHRQLTRLGAISRLRKAGAEDGDTVVVGDAELEFTETLLGDD